MGIKFSVNEKFFDVWSLEMSYVLGFLYADGHLEDSPYIRGKYVRVINTDRDRIELIKPGGGVVCFPRIKNGERINTNQFYQLLNETYKTFVGPGHWFEMPDHYMRIGFGWPSKSELIQGLKNISNTLDDMKL